MMSDFMSLRVSVALVLLAAGGYALATAGMKLAAHGQVSRTAIVLIVIGFLFAASAEVILMTRSELAVVYVAVISTETLLVLMLAFAFGEHLNPRQIAGGILALVGVGLTLSA